MAIQFGTVDGLVNISNDTILCFAKGIEEFATQGAPAIASKEGISYGAAFQRFIEPVYADRTKSYTLESIRKPVLTKSGSEQSPARGTFCKKMGLLKIDESNDLFEITPLGKAIIDNDIRINEYAFILLSKMGVFKDDVYVDNLLVVISSYFQSHATISQNELSKYVKATYNDLSLVKTRFDIIINALVATGLITKVTNDVYVLAGIGQAEVLMDYYNHSNLINKAEIDTSDEYSNYIGNLVRGGIFDVLNNENVHIYARYFPNIATYINSSRSTKIVDVHKRPLEHPLQQIFYGAPGTGKSNTIKCEVDDKGLPNIRTTFHPDTDYSTFVGAYKPTSIDVPVMTMIGTKAVPVENSEGTPRMEKKIVYEFVPQAFLKAYTEAWKNQDEPFFLIIEEINRGNCAQIFGDLFQLLDRNDEGESDYPISPDEDIQKFLLTDKKYGFAELTEEQKEAIPEEIKLGQLLKLPKNLHIWATMNTSDQSLFPIDSAFKRRWDWQYMPISDGKKDWKIEVNGKRYDWWLFLVKINETISDTTNSEDKKLGYYFCKAKNGKIDVETFVGKVIFYLWNDVFKDFAEEAGDLFQDEDGLLTFNKFYMVDTDGKTRVVEDKVELFLKNLGVEEDEVIEYMQDDEAEAMPTDRATDASNRLHVVFSDGETIRIQTGKEYVDVLKKIGLDKAYEIAKSKNPGILKCAFVTKEKEDAIENSSYLRYETIGEYHVVRGMSGDTMRPFLEKISNRYNLGLKFYRQ